MADITAAMVKDLREKSGAGMMDCKKALAEANGDMDAALDWLRTKGLAAAQKKSSRSSRSSMRSSVRTRSLKGCSYRIEDTAGGRRRLGRQKCRAIVAQGRQADKRAGRRPPRCLTGPR